jgi:hypothetical protein
LLKFIKIVGFILFFVTLNEPRFLTTEKGIRGGIRVVTKKCSEANKYMIKYNPDLPSKYIIYLNCNNLYEGSMSEPMPFGGFRCITPNQFLAERQTNIPDNVSYFVEVILIIQLCYTIYTTIILFVQNQ